MAKGTTPDGHKDLIYWPSITIEKVRVECQDYLDDYVRGTSTNLAGYSDLEAFANGCAENIFDLFEGNDPTAMVFASMCQAYIVGRIDERRLHA